MPTYDVIIKDGMIFDGARNPRYKADIGIKDGVDRKSTRLNSSHLKLSRMPSSA